MKDLKAYKPKQIIVRMPNWVGDLVMATPILADLKKSYPEAKITAMCKKSVCGLLKYDPHLSEIYCFSKGKKLGRRDTHRDIVEKIRSGRYDLGILLTNSFSSAWYFWQGRVKFRLGFRKDLRSCLLTHPVGFPKNLKEQHLVLTYKGLLTPLGIPPSDTVPQLYVTKQEKDESKELLKRYGLPLSKVLVGINPGAAYGSAKCWLPERFREVARRLMAVDERIHLLFFGDASQTELMHAITKGLPPRAVNLAGVTSLRELMALIGQCDAFLTNDSGPMHIAAALNVPLVALFGSTSEIYTGPYNKGVVINKKTSCSPCFKRKCPIDFRCMKQITVEDVLEKMMEILEKKLKEKYVEKMD